MKHVLTNPFVPFVNLMLSSTPKEPGTVHTGPGRRGLYTHHKAIQRKHQSRYPFPKNSNGDDHRSDGNHDQSKFNEYAVRRAARYLRKCIRLDLDPIDAPAHLKQKLKLWSIADASLRAALDEEAQAHSGDLQQGRVA